jgi:hypothetical protein
VVRAKGCLAARQRPLQLLLGTRQVPKICWRGSPI